MRGKAHTSGYVKHLGKGAAEGAVDLRCGDGHALRGERGDAVLGDAAGYDAAVVGEVGVDVERDAVEPHPMADAYADGGDLALAPMALVDPDSDPARPPLALEV